MPTKIKQERLEYTDRLKGVLILWVVWYHTTHPSWVGAYCHVPLFFILSGVFLKTETDFHTYIMKRINNLLVPFLFFYLFGFAYNLALNIMQGTLSNFLSPRLLYAWLLPEGLPFNTPIWYIIALFWITILAYPLLKRRKSRWIIVGLALVCSYLYNVYYSDLLLPLSGNNVIIWLPFLLFGHYFGQYAIDQRTNKRQQLIQGSIQIVLLILLSWYETEIAPIGVAIYYLRIFLLFGVAIPLFRYLLLTKKLSFLAYFGKNSLILLGIQSLFINFMIKWMRPLLHLPENEWVGLMETIATAVLSIPIIYLFNRYAPQFVGKQRSGTHRTTNKQLLIHNIKQYGNTRI